MDNDKFEEVEKKIATQLGCSVEEFSQQYDKKVITSNVNKDGEELFIFRSLVSEEIGKKTGTFSNKARYMIYTKDGQYAGYIEVAVANSKEANEAEIQYMSAKELRNKGNITISLEEVLKDIFVDKSFDGLQIKPFFPKVAMKKVFLAINEDNYASQAVALKSGFIKRGEDYEITEEEFLERFERSDLATMEAIRESLAVKQQEYAEMLARFNPASIEKAFKVLEERRKKVKQNEENAKQDTQILDEETRKIFELMSEYEQAIKQIFIDNGENITHITSVSPEDMRGGKILRSANRANNYETERGDWVFASSSPMDGRNPYIARNSQDGMVLIYKNTYIYGSDNMQIQQDEQGQSRVLLKKPNYVYKINPKKFKPVVTLMRDANDKPYFEFSEEWISDEEVDVNNPEQVLGIEKITDITDVIRNYQVLCDANKTGEAMKIRASASREEAIQMLLASIQSGNLRYINGEANINVSQMLENSEIENIIGKATIGATTIEQKDKAQDRQHEDEQQVKTTTLGR